MWSSARNRSLGIAAMDSAQEQRFLFVFLRRSTTMKHARGGRLLPVLAALFVALLLLSGSTAEGEDEEGSPVTAEEPEAPMEAKEKAALYAAIGSFVGKAWNGSGLFSDPCSQTPIQGVSSVHCSTTRCSAPRAPGSAPGCSASGASRASPSTPASRRPTPRPSR
ncbi:hypothetical protein ACQJBY_036367 [Aegilops geniculata]